MLYNPVNLLLFFVTTFLPLALLIILAVGLRRVENKIDRVLDHLARSEERR